jgi:hypothetical protein
MDIFDNLNNSRYYNTPPRGGYQVDEEYNYIFVDDISSMLFLDIITRSINTNKETIKDKLKKIKYHRVKEMIPEITCSICIDTFQIGEYQRTLCCTHSFHKKCIDRWFKKNKTDCPMCRKIIIN